MPPAVKSLAKSLIHSSGVLRGFRFLYRHNVRILMYHRFPANTEALREQCRHISRYYESVSLNDISEWLHSDKQLPANAIAVTVDDGYRDFLLNAHAVFREFNIPVMVYLVSDFVDAKLWLWWNQIEYAFENTSLETREVNLPIDNIKVNLDTPEERFQSGRRVAEALTDVENSERVRLLSLIPKLLRVDLPTQPPGDLAPLSWDEVRQLQKNGVDFGCHTKTHPILSRITRPDEQEEEIKFSKLRLEAELSRQINHFCYPNGSFSDFNDETLRVVGSLGFHTAVTTAPGLNSRETPPYLLRRLPVDPEFLPDYFERLLSGAFRA
jgi:peptidoglycan/xylan/chitin deacetylase (PgdA/CDA1 family)